MELNPLSNHVLTAAIEVHRELGGPGLLEAVYEEALAAELGLRGVKCQRQVPVNVVYKGQKINSPLFIDLLVDGRLVVEVKAVEKFNPIYKSQLLTYLRLGNFQLGMVINFGERLVKDGVHRVVNRLK